MTKPVIAVIGGGSWATALVKILSNNVDKINWWVRSADTAGFINKYRHNPNYLSDVEINLEKVFVSNDLTAVISSSEIIILSVPSAFLKPALEKINPQ
jgi:glycerol-3-phosphate dehydrogenase (NAD(P)+)